MNLESSDSAAAASLLGMPEGLFRSVFELNDLGFALLEDPQGPPFQEPSVVYANAAYQRLCELQASEPGQVGQELASSFLESSFLPVPSLAIEAFPRVLADQSPASHLGYESAWQRWIHLYLFPASDRLAGAFITDPALLSEGVNPNRRSPAEFGDLVIDHDARRVTMRGEPVPLTRTEYELLALLAQTPNQVVSRAQALRALWDTSWLGSSPALDVHVSRLRRKLGESGADPRYIHSIRGAGLIFVPDHYP